MFRSCSNCPATVSKIAGLGLILAGIIHLGIYLAQILSGDNPSWEGPLSLRKPILFCISTGLTLWSAGWLFTLLPSRKFDLLISGTLSVALVAEVCLISMQTWRAVRSHFNQGGPFDRGVETAMTLLITIAVILLFWLTIRCFLQIHAQPDMKVAIRAGMLYLIASCIIGFAITSWGHRQIALGLAPEIVGTAGVAKFPHGLAIHAIQFLPLSVWLQNKIGLIDSQSTKLTMGLSVILGLLLMFSILQTVQGRSRFDLTMLSGGLLIVTTAYGIFLSAKAIQFYYQNRTTNAA